MLLVPVPWARRVWALPFLSVLLCPTLLRPAGQAPQEDNRLVTADAPPGEALVARTRTRGRGRFRLC